MSFRKLSVIPVCASSLEYRLSQTIVTFQFRVALFEGTQGPFQVSVRRTRKDDFPRRVLTTELGKESGLAGAEECTTKDGVSEVLTALQSDTYYLTGTTNTSRETCYYVTATESLDACQPGTQVTYGYKDHRKWVNFTGVVSGTGKVFPSDIHGPLCGTTVEARGENCFTLRNNNATEMWVTKKLVDTPPSCCKEVLRSKRYQTTYEHEVC
ncbi:uncharacterized protein LOC135366585 [Ornithodoros turicata]|uniref:uncharacterized protein LOC135366585 n=1 Tax=Ornithodoros turicata TaxID=34597 RepID=UPI003139E397